MKQKSLVNQNPYGKEFLDTFEMLANKYGKFKVWNDFIFLSACSISNGSDPRLQRYNYVVDQYNTEECTIFFYMIKYVFYSLRKNPRQLFLKDMFEALGLNNKGRYKPDTLYNIDFYNAAYELQHEMEKAGEDIIFLCVQDKDPMIAQMHYIQLSALGLQAIVKIGDPLSDPYVPEDFFGDKVWITPKFALNFFSYNKLHSDEFLYNQNTETISVKNKQALPKKQTEQRKNNRISKEKK